MLMRFTVLYLCLIQSCPLYGGLRGVLDYGVMGCALLENIRAALKHHFTNSLPPLNPWEPPDGDECIFEDWRFLEKDEEAKQGRENLRDNVFLVETAAIGPAEMWQHSGHMDLFHDDVVQCTDTGTILRWVQYTYAWRSVLSFFRCSQIHLYAA